MKNLQIKRFYLPKAGNTSQEYEDASAYRLSRKTQRLVIADGATQGFESKNWALFLTSCFKKELPAFKKKEFENWLKKPIENWKGTINWGTIPWYAEEKARRGAFSTLLGLDFGKRPHRKWRAIAVGDSCLFHIREDELVLNFPVESSKDFNSTPDLLSTRQDYNNMSLDNIKVCSGNCSPNDRFILATDAFSAWFLSQVEIGKKPWKLFFELARIDVPDSVKHKIFHSIVNYLRDKGEMQNDDVTVLLAEYKE